MPPTVPAPKTPIVALEEAISLVLDAITLAEKGLEMNPSLEEERALNETLNNLDLKRAAIRAKLDALIAKTRQVSGPTQEQVARISVLAAQVGAQTNASVTASAAVGLT
jgi:hypothetical protein